MTHKGSTAPTETQALPSPHWRSMLPNYSPSLSLAAPPLVLMDLCPDMHTVSIIKHLLGARN